ncbi:MAG: hypothetical protein Hens3KO_04080 [Henriciella sp.]
MSEQLSGSAFLWTAHHSKEAHLRRSLGQSYAFIAEAFGCCRTTVLMHVKNENLNTPLSGLQRFHLIAEIEANKIVADLLDVEAGSTMQARLRTSLLALSKHINDDRQIEEENMDGKQSMKEMGDDELQTYLAPLVSGLEGKGANERSLRDRETGDYGVAVSEDSSPRSETAVSRDKLA